jgi:hypothetical protein
MSWTLSRPFLRDAEGVIRAYARPADFRGQRRESQ